MVTGRIKRALYFGFCGILSTLNKIVPKKEDRILFFSTTNLYDNSEALYTYFQKNGYGKRYEIVCAVRNPEAYRGKEAKTKFISVFKSIPYLLTAKYIFYHNEILAIRPTENQISIDFWHATTLKKINRQLPQTKNYKFDFFTYITATSELFRSVFSEAFGCSLNRVIINGHPRNDYLFIDSNELKKLGLKREVFSKIFIWFPTYRVSYNRNMVDVSDEFLSESGLPIFKTRCELELLNKFLKQKRAYMFIKIHPTQITLPYDYSDFECIKFLFNKQLENLDIKLYSLLREVDALITDYSSVSFDFMLLNRPIGFTIDDINSYTINRGFVFDDPFQFMPGEKISCAQEFYSFLDHCFKDFDLYKSERERVNNLVNAYQDGENCKRIVEIVGLKHNE